MGEVPVSRTRCRADTPTCSLPTNPSGWNTAYGPNAARLIAAKKAYDPDNIFTATPLPGVAAPGR
jgi:hypothetical protein